MDRLLRSRIASNLVLLAAAASVPAAAMHLLSREHAAPVDGVGHLLIMAIVSGIAAAASTMLMLSGARTRDARAVIAGGAFAAMTILLALHGLATPGVLLGPNGVIALAGGAALPFGAALLSLTAAPVLRRQQHLGRLVAGLGALLAALVAGAIAALLHPAVVPALPQTGSPLAKTLVAVGIVFYALLAMRAVRTFVLTRRLSDLAVMIGLVWLGCALVPTLLFAPGTWAWWTGHTLELSGVALVGVPVALDVRRGHASRPLAGDLSPAELVAAEAAFLGPQVQALVARLEAKDRSTEEHTRRVAQLAVAIGEQLGLAPGRLRDLALGGLLHDVGKLWVPDAILGKPGALTDAEFAVVREHPRRGDELLAELGYADRLRCMVRGHHERLDGSGYPDGLAGDEVGLETRILAVADVWDALVSARVYRPAWDHDRALGLLREEAGTAFDARCVAALERLVDVPGTQLAQAA